MARFLKTLSTLILICGLFSAVQAQTEQTEKDQVNVTIIKKSVNEDGTEVTEEITIEGADEIDELHSLELLQPNDIQTIDVRKLDEQNMKVIIRTKTELEEAQEELKKSLIEGKVIVEELDDACQNLQIFKTNDENVFIHQMGDMDKNIWVHKQASITPSACLGVYIEHTIEEEIDDNGSSRMVSQAVVSGLIEGSGAEAAGIAEGDIIIEFNGKEVANSEVLIDFLKEAEVGEEVNVVLLRDGQDISKTVTLQHCPGYNGIEHDVNVDVEIIEDEEGIQQIICESTPTDDIERIIIIRKRTDVAEDDNTLEEEVFFPEALPNLDQDLQLQDFRAFPNPTNETLNIQFQGSAEPIRIEINSIEGRNIFTDARSTFDGNYNRQIDFSRATPGTYVLSILQGGKLYQEMIIKN